MLPQRRFHVRPAGQPAEPSAYSYLDGGSRRSRRSELGLSPSRFQSCGLPQRRNRTKLSRSTRDLAWLVWRLIQAFPLVQRNYPNLRSPFAWKLGDELQEVAIRIIEVDRGGWDPAEHAGHVSNFLEEVAQLDSTPLDGSHRAAQIGEVNLEGEMLGDDLVSSVSFRGPGRFLPKTQSGLAMPAYPVDGHASRLLLQTKFEAQGLLVELHCALEILHMQVRFEESGNKGSRRLAW